MYQKLPMFTRIGSKAYKDNLDNTIAFCNELGNPQNNFKTIHVGGTNGKGSTSHLIASVLQERGLKVGLYTSPHLKDFRERIKINGKEISKEEIVIFIERHKNFIEQINPSFFEMTVALCFDYFSAQKVDVAVIEVGLGGRLDSTNIINPMLSVITNIGWDHTDLLGDTLEKIALEKAGIIKNNTPVVIGEKDAATANVFANKAKECNSKIIFASQDYSIPFIKFNPDFILCDIEKHQYRILKNLDCDLTGQYQKNNILTTIAAIDILNELGFEINEKDIRFGFLRCKQNTGLAGRWHVMAKKPLIVCDTAHNSNGIEYVVSQILQQKYNHLHVVFGMVSDKDISKILALMPKDATYYFCRANIPRALDEKELQAKAANYGLMGETYSTVAEALEAAKHEASDDDMIFIGGSTFVVSEVL